MYTYNISKALSEIFEISFKEIPELSDQILNYIPEDTTQSSWNKSGWKHTEESKLLMSQKKLGNKSHSGRTLSSEHKARISESRLGTPAWNKGKPNPNAASNARKGALKLSASVTGRKRKYRQDGSWYWEYPNK